MSPFSPLRLAHLVRPAQGGMVTQVRALLDGMPDLERLLAAPEEVVRDLASSWPAAQVADRETTPFYVVAPPPINPRDLLRHGDLVGRWAKAQRATLLHGHGLLWSPLFAMASHRSQVPLVITLHNLVSPPADLSLTQRIALRAALGRATRLIAVSEAVAQSARRALGPGSPTSSRLRVVRNGIDTERFADTLNRAEARQSLALPASAKIVLCIARLSPEKGIADLLEAVTRMKTENFCLLIAGDGPEYAALVHRVSENELTGRVQLLGHRRDIAHLLRAADLAVVPSRAEGLGIAAIEAMAAGLPVVAARAGGLPEVVVDNETGVLVPPANPPALATALDTLLSNPQQRQQMGNAGRERARTYLSAAQMIAETRAVYTEALAA